VRVHVPRTAEGRREQCYAKLIRTVSDNRTAMAFEGNLLRCGAVIDDAELWPGEDWPAAPLLLEYAGLDYRAPLQRLANGYGGKRRPLIHILWRYDCDECEWRELVRSSSVDGDWVQQFAAIARVELGRGAKRPPVEVAALASARCVEALDRELRELKGEELILALGFLYEQVAARMVELDKCA
jgi:hypothetical protein